MADYIKREDVEELADDILNMVDELRSCGQIDYHAYSELFDNLCGFSTIPAADVAPVVHGWWKRVDPRSTVVTFRCSKCNYYAHVNATNFCPNCGADMREVDDG